MSRSQKDALKHLPGLARQIELHLEKITAYPGHESANHWRHEARTLIRDVESILSWIGRKTQTRLKQQIEGWRNRLGD